MDNPIFTQNISCLLLEDDEEWLKIMTATLNAHFPLVEISAFSTLAAASRAYASQQQNLLILDINLPDGTSFDWLQSLEKTNHNNFRVIFTTAFADYALTAFKFSALDFLLKPYSPAELIAAVAKATNSINEQHYRKQLETFIHNYTHQDKKDKKIVLKTLEEIFVVNITDIVTATADNSYTHFLLKSGQSILVSQSLKEFDHQLSPSGFMRVHQSHLVNVHYILAYKKKTNTLLLEGELQIPVSQNKKMKVMEYLNGL
jgi:two-component system LytT family response regulator